MKYGLYQKSLFPLWGGGGAARKPRTSNMLGKHSLHIVLMTKDGCGWGEKIAHPLQCQPGI